MWIGVRLGLCNGSSSGAHSIRSDQSIETDLSFSLPLIEVKYERTVRLWAAGLSSFFPTVNCQVRELPTVKSGKTSELSVIKLFTERSYRLENLMCYVWQKIYVFSSASATLVRGSRFSVSHLDYGGCVAKVAKVPKMGDYCTPARGTMEIMRSWFHGPLNWYFR